MTKSRLLVSLMVIALAAALIGGATMAWFTDSDESEPVTMTAGTLLIDIDNNFEEVIGANVENLNPGDSWEWEFTVENVGSKSFNWLLYLCWQDISGDLLNDLPEGYGTNGLSEKIVWEITGNTSAETYVWDGVLPEEGPVAINMPAFGAGDSETYKIRAYLPGNETGNECQGSQLNLAVGVLAGQTTNDAPLPNASTIVCPFDENYEPESLAFGYQNDNWFMEIVLADGDTFGDLTSFKASLYDGENHVVTNVAKPYLFETYPNNNNISTTFSGGTGSNNWKLGELGPGNADKVVVEFIKDGNKYTAESSLRNDGGI